MYLPSDLGTTVPGAVVRRLGTAASIAIVLVCTLGLNDAEAQSSSLKSTQDGVFSEAQAKSGEETFETACAACHEPSQFGDTFIQAWAGATVGDLFDLVSALMPEDQPGSLEPGQYVAVLSYIFQMNGLPPGPVALDEQREVLGSIRIEN